MTKNVKARIVNVQRWNDYRLFSLEAPEIAGEARPGQFLMIKVSGHPFPLLRRPISIHARTESRLEILFQVAGMGTEILSGKQAGENLDILGPLGKGFTLNPDLKGKEVFLVGGGRGIAPLFFLADELQSLGIKPLVLYGGKTRGDLPARERFEFSGLPVLCSTDDGSFGFKGLVTGLLEEEIRKRLPAFFFACGPDAMMKAIAERARKLGLPAEFSLESLMGCGIGACWGCVKRVRREGREGWIKICEEGPVFPLEEIVWAEGD